MGTDDIIIAQNLAKQYRSGFLSRDRTTALRDISLSVRRGEIFGILGPNGAGKTTLQNIFASLLTPDSGRIIIDGIDVTHGYPRELKMRINMSSGNPNLPWSLTVTEMLKFYGLLYGLSGSALKDKISSLIETFGLEAIARRQFDQLSTGNKQRLALAKALINNPEILLLDEPTVGLDPDVALRIREHILGIHRSRQMTIILTTHYMAEAQTMCNRIAFIRNGEVKALGTAEELIRKTAASDMEGVFIELSK